MIDLGKLQQAFAKLSGRAPRLFSAPGRVNLIGEHTDYNEGFVLPFAASLRTYVAAALRDDEQVRVHSDLTGFAVGARHAAPVPLNESTSFRLARSEDTACRVTTSETEKDFQTVDRDQPGDGWVRYIQGVTETLVAAGLTFGGADLAIASEVPIGAGLSSSAALEISVGYGLAKLAAFEIAPLHLARAAQKAEHDFVGANSGLMDQLTATCGKKDHAMFIDCRSYEITQIPLELPEIAVVICDTRVKHALASSAYNQRRRECEQAVELLREQKPEVNSLRDVEVSDLQIIEELPEPERRRARHVVTENERTVQAVEALEAGDVVRLGKLMRQSHASLRDDFEVSCRELDIMFELAASQALGARMMGGGFGGCTINLVLRDSLDNFKEHMTAGYRQATGLDPVIHVVRADDGVNELSF
ncbi:MAG TPA: galactokinase [Pyrinomonadaceae bacterium]|jgi:galactokinase